MEQKMSILQNNWCNYCFIRQAEAWFYIRHKNKTIITFLTWNTFNVKIKQRNTIVIIMYMYNKYI